MPFRLEGAAKGASPASGSVTVRVPLAEAVPAVPLATPPASTTAPLSVPEIWAVSLAPWMVMTTSLVVPSSAAMVKVSVTTSPGFSASIAGSLSARM